MLSIRLALALALVPALLALGGCGGGEAKPEPIKPGSNVPPGGAVETARVLKKEEKGLPADEGQWMAEVGVDPAGDLSYTVAEVVLPPGNANFRLVNPRAKGHDLTIEQVGGGHVSTAVIREGSRWIRVSFLTGEKYVFYCSIPGHREAGMEGIIRVDPSLEAGDLKPF